VGGQRRGTAALFPDHTRPVGVGWVRRGTRQRGPSRALCTARAPRGGRLPPRPPPPPWRAPPVRVAPADGGGRRLCLRQPAPPGAGVWRSRGPCATRPGAVASPPLATLAPCRSGGHVRATALGGRRRAGVAPGCGARIPAVETKRTPLGGRAWGGGGGRAVPPVAGGWLRALGAAGGHTVGAGREAHLRLCLCGGASAAPVPPA